jgi:hypothetical protein
MKHGPLVKWSNCRFRPPLLVWFNHVQRIQVVFIACSITVNKCYGIHRSITQWWNETGNKYLCRGNIINEVGRSLWLPWVLSLLTRMILVCIIKDIGVNQWQITWQSNHKMMLISHNVVPNVPRDISRHTHHCEMSLI